MVAQKKIEKNLHQRLSDIMAECHGLDKSGRNDFHKYNYITAEQVDNMLRPLFVKHGVVLHQRVMKSEQRGNITEVWYEFEWVNVDSPDLCFNDSWVAYGQDNGDKGPNKCHTAARKYYLLKFFMLGSDVDTDKEKTAPNDNPTAYEVKAAQSLAKDKGLDWETLPQDRRQKAIDFVRGQK